MKTAKKLLALLLCLCMVLTGASFGSVYAEEGEGTGNEGHVHNYGDPDWSVGVDYTSMTALFSCDDCEDKQSLTDNAPQIIEQRAASCTENQIVTFIGKVRFNEADYTGTIEDVEVLNSAHHTYGAPAWNWTANYSKAEATFTCEKGDDTQTVKTEVIQKNVVSPATCTDDEVVTYSAEVEFQGEKYPVQTENITVEGTATQHQYVQTVVEPTCTEKGYTEFKCEKCDDIYYRDFTNASGHDFGEWTTTQDATCTAAGEEISACSRCDAVASRPILPSGHAYGEWTVTTAPGCLTTGQEMRKCEKCDDEETKSIAALGHSFDETDETKVSIQPATCTENGLKTVTCLRCDQTSQTVIPALGHSFDETDETKVSIQPATCTEDGLKTVTCLRCDQTSQTVLPALGHSYDAETTLPTCTQDGVTTYTCSRCKVQNDEISETIPATGHSFDETDETKVSIQPATCTENGLKTVTCLHCDQTSQTVLPATGHNFDETVETKVSVQPATCTADGLKTVTCLHCDQTSQTVLPATGHNFDETDATKVSVQPATCTADGLKTVTCLRCSQTVQTVLPATGHSFDAETTPPTCTTNGVTKYTCSRCQYHTADMDQPIPALGHSYDDTDPTKVKTETEAKCETEGLLKVTCQRCDHTVDRVIPALGHDFDESITENVTTAMNGLISVKCSRCAEVAMRAQKGDNFHYFEMVDPGKYTSQTALYKQGLGPKPDNYPENENAMTQTTWEVKYGKCGTKCLNIHEDGTPHDDYNFSNHVFEDCTIVGEATCTTNAKWYGKCKNCGYEVTEENAQYLENSAAHPLKEHTYGNWKPVDNETHKGTCINGTPDCYAVQVLPHNYGEWTYQNDETFLKNGHNQRKCLDCGYSNAETDWEEVQGTSRWGRFVGTMLGASLFGAWIYTGVVFALARWFGVSEDYLAGFSKYFGNK